MGVYTGRKLLDVDPTLVYRVEFDGASKRNPGHASYGFAVLEDVSGLLVLSGNGVLRHGLTNNEAEYLGLIHGLQAAAGHGVRRAVVQGDSQLVVKQLQGSYMVREPRMAALLERAQELVASLEEVVARQVPRNSNLLADGQAGFALALDAWLQGAAQLTPSGYSAAARKLGQLLALPPGGCRFLEDADDFQVAAAQLVAARCSLSVDVVAARISEARTTSPAAPALQPTSPRPAAAAQRAARAAPDPPGGAALLLTPGLSMSKVYTRREAAAYAAFAAATLDPETQERAVRRGGLAVPTALWLHPLPPALGGDAAAQEDDDGLSFVALPAPAAAAASVGPLEEAPVAAPALMDSPPAPPGEVAAAASAQVVSAVYEGGGGAIEESQVAAEAGDMGGAGDEGEEEALRALATALEMANGESELLHSSVDDYAECSGMTHLLMFDGASRGNPGRAGYGWLLYDLRSRRLLCKGCRSLPYGLVAVEAEYTGLLTGMMAAQAVGVRRLLVTGDSDIVVSQMAVGRGVAPGSRAAQLWLRTRTAAASFEAFEMLVVPRHQNRQADRLANVSIDIDAALYFMLREDRLASGAAAATHRSADGSSNGSSNDGSSIGGSTGCSTGGSGGSSYSGSVRGVGHAGASPGEARGYTAEFQQLLHRQHLERYASGQSSADKAVHVLLKAARLWKKAQWAERVAQSVPFPELLLALLHQLMGMNGQELLERLLLKGQAMGDHNPLLAQEVRALLAGGGPGYGTRARAVAAALLSDARNIDVREQMRSVLGWDPKVHRAGVAAAASAAAAAGRDGLGAAGKRSGATVDAAAADGQLQTPEGVAQQQAPRRRGRPRLAAVPPSSEAQLQHKEQQQQQRASVLVFDQHQQPPPAPPSQLPLVLQQPPTEACALPPPPPLQQQQQHPPQSPPLRPPRVWRRPLLRQSARQNPSPALNPDPALASAASSTSASTTPAAAASCAVRFTHTSSCAHTGSAWRHVHAAQLGAAASSGSSSSGSGSGPPCLSRAVPGTQPGVRGTRPWLQLWSSAWTRGVATMGGSSNSRSCPGAAAALGAVADFAGRCPLPVPNNRLAAAHAPPATRASLLAVTPLPAPWHTQGHLLPSAAGAMARGLPLLLALGVCLSSWQ